MGNSESFIKNFRGRSATNVMAKTVNETDDEEEGLEAEVFECSSVEPETDLETHTDKCKTNHTLYTPVEDFITDINGDGLLKLPQNIRHESVLEYISFLEKLVVRFRVNGSKSSKYGTGFVYISSGKLETYDTCPLVNCKFNKGQAHKCYGGMIVYTNKHVIQDNNEAECCKVDFFYYRKSDSWKSYKVDGTADVNEGSKEIQVVCKNSNEINYDDSQINNIRDRLPKYIIMFGYKLQDDQNNKDLVGLRILYHDEELYTTIKNYSDLRLGAWSKIPKEIKLELRKHAIIVSHPHGWPKQISFGTMISLEEDYYKEEEDKEKIVYNVADVEEKRTKVTKYYAATCKGSSGAPVLTGHYPYRPFVHSSKKKPEQLGYSFSY